ncbi:ATP synthase F0 subcomplex subunit OSCP atp5 [Batrachochytrium dendrobatidis]
MLTEAPIALHGVDGRYATALYGAALKDKVLEKVEQELKMVESLIAKDVGVQSFLNAPLLDRTTKREGVKSLLSQGKYSTVTKNFFDLLAENGRLNQTEKIIASFAQLMSAGRGEVPVVVTSAKELDAKTLGKLRDVLAKSKLVAPGSKLLVSNKINPEIIGGLVVEVGDKTVDLSVLSKVTKLNNLLTQAV